MNNTLSEKLEKLIYNANHMFSGLLLSENAILELIQECILSITKAPNFYIALYDERNNSIRFVIAVVDNIRINRKSRNIDKEKFGLVEEVIVTKEPILLQTSDEVKKWLDQPGHYDYIGHMPTTYLGVPMYFSEEVLGMIGVYFCDKEYAVDMQTLDVLSVLSTQAAIALENNRKYNVLKQKLQAKTKQLKNINIRLHNERERSKALKLLNQFGERINTTLDLGEVMASTVEGAMRLTSASSGVVHLLKENELFIERSFGYPKNFEHPVPCLDQPDSITRTIIKIGEPIIRQASEERARLHSEIVKERVESIIGTPLILRGEVVGVLYLNFDHQYSFGQEVRTWLDTLTEQAAIAVDKIRLYETLEEKVRERTRQLEIVNRQAHEREILAVLGEVSAGLIHKMSNTIGHVPALTNRVERSIDSKETDAHHKLHQIRDGVSDALEYIGSLGKILELQKITKAEADPSLLIRDSIRQTREIIKSNSIELVENYDGLPTIFVNSTLLIEVFRNIIRNSVEAMPSGGQLEITGSFAKDKIYIQIRDTGYGIVEEDIPKLFSPGYSTKKEGKGIGLWFSKTVIEQHQGTISVKSEKDKGTTFLITLPVGSPNDSVEYAEQEVSNV